MHLQGINPPRLSNLQRNVVSGCDGTAENVIVVFLPIISTFDLIEFIEQLARAAGKTGTTINVFKMHDCNNLFL